jgi:hypothetical protein
MNSDVSNYSACAAVGEVQEVLCSYPDMKSGCPGVYFGFYSVSCCGSTLIGHGRFLLRALSSLFSNYPPSEAIALMNYALDYNNYLEWRVMYQKRVEQRSRKMLLHAVSGKYRKVGRGWFLEK